MAETPPVEITSYPPLGQVTVLKDERILFTVILESTSEKSWGVEVWHNIESPEWTALPLRKCPLSAAQLLNGGLERDTKTRHVFSGAIDSSKHSCHARFTVRYRENPDEDWRWANQEQHVGDGELILASLAIDEKLIASTAEDLGRYFDDLSADIDVQTRKSEAPGAVLWHLSGPVEPAHDDEPGIGNLPLGVPSSVSRFLALVRVWTPWLGPRQGKGKLFLKEDAVLCSFLRTDGVHVVLLGVSGVDDVLTVFRSGANGEVVVKSQNDNPDSARFQVLVSAANDFEIAMSAVVYEARKLVRPYDTLKIETDIQWRSSWYDGLTYCTWNGIGKDLTEAKILSALDDLKAQGIGISGLIIDDNWQTLDNENAQNWEQGWKRFEGNPDAFPQGIKKTVAAIRRGHPTIEHIAVWHSLLGYWGGISPDGELAANYKNKELQIRNPTNCCDVNFSAKRTSVLAIDPDDVQRFYDDFYRFLSSAGINGVKTDCQYFLDLIKNPADRRRFTTSYQDAWTLSSLKHFASKAVSCMSLFPQNIFHSLLPTNKPAILVRNSDDFFPDVDDSHAWHVFCNAHNALLTRHLNVLPDWDMFQTSHPYAGFHAAARCVSGGPVYITDVPGEHNLDLINQMTAQTTQGTTVILRPSLVGRTLDTYNPIEEGHILRVGTYTGRARTGSGIIGLFNVSSRTASAIFPLIDFPGIYGNDDEGQYIVRAHTTGQIAEALHPSDPHALVSVKLEHRGWEILTAYPTHPFTLKNNSDTHVAVLGLLGKMTGVAAIVSSDIYIESNGRLRVEVALKAVGTLGIYISDLAQWDIEKNFMVLISGQPVPRETVAKEGRVLTVDVQTAWKDMNLQPGWSNEVRVTVFLH